MKDLVYASLWALAFLSPFSLYAERVVKVSDGDTITVLDDENRQSRVRLWGIDAPESKQAFGKASQKHLAKAVAGKDVRLEIKGKDRYGRIIARVWIDNEDVCLRQIRDGFAWHYKHYAPDEIEFAKAEEKARERHLGLWQDRNPIPPWEFRRQKR